MANSRLALLPAVIYLANVLAVGEDQVAGKLGIGFGWLADVDDSSQQRSTLPLRRSSHQVFALPNFGFGSPEYQSPF